MMLDIFQKYQKFYTDPVVRPQPIDFVLSYFKDKEAAGVFVDVGASDGITWSNSVALKDFLGWDGLCIEPHPDAFERLVENRPNDTCLNIGSNSFNGTMLFYKVNGYAEMLSGFYDDYDPRHVDRIHKDIANHGGSIDKIVIDVERLETTLDQHDIEAVDYLSIDVEGGELSVLEGLNLSKNKPTLISIEDNGYTLGPHKHLIENGYQFLRKVAGDCFYESSIL